MSDGLKQAGFFVDKFGIPIMLAVFLGYQTKIDLNREGVSDSVTNVSVLETKLNNITEDLFEIKADLKVSTKSRYTTEDAAKDTKRLQAQINAFEERQREGFERIIILENQVKRD